jgi:hypothetical protein
MELVGSRLLILVIIGTTSFKMFAFGQCPPHSQLLLDDFDWEAM